MKANIFFVSIAATYHITINKSRFSTEWIVKPERYGAHDDIEAPTLFKPKGMHQTIFERPKKQEAIANKIAMKKWQAVYDMLQKHNEKISRGD